LFHIFVATYLQFFKILRLKLIERLKQKLTKITHLAYIRHGVYMPNVETNLFVSQRLT